MRRRPGVGPGPRRVSVWYSWRVLTDSEKVLQRELYRALRDEQLQEDDPRYFHLYELPSLEHHDPVERLRFPISAQEQGVQLFSGYRGTGKSTELRRLARGLRASNYCVVLVDYESLANTSTPVDITDFLLTVVGSLGEELASAKLLTGPSFFERFASFLGRLQVQVDGLTLSAQAGAGAQLKLNLKDPSFKARLQHHLVGSLGAFVEEAHDFVRAAKAAVRAKGYDNLVLIVDSIEHIRGGTINREEVQASLEALFTQHNDKLALPGIHVVYTAPPYLKIRYQALSTLYDLGVQLLPAIRVRKRGGQLDPELLDGLRTLVSRRGPIERLLSTEQLDEIIKLSGGHLRLLFSMLREIVARARSLPVSQAVVEDAIVQSQSGYTPIADEDVRWLARVAETKEPPLATRDDVVRFSGFLDVHLVGAYRNGEEWYDVLPLLADYVRRRARALEAGERSA